MKTKGFTLVESLFCIAIIMIILLLVVPNVTNKNNAIKNSACKAQLEMVNSLCQLYEIEYGELPDSIDDLIEAGYLKEEQRSCPNGDPISIDDGQAYN